MPPALPNWCQRFSVFYRINFKGKGAERLNNSGKIMTAIQQSYDDNLVSGVDSHDYPAK
jgi:hypothetical protein